MATIYSLPDPDDVSILSRVVADWHKDLAAVESRVQILFASADPEDESPKAPVKHGGYPARATIRVISTKDRLVKGYDAEMLVDRDWWGGASEARKVALLDHELSHLEVVTKTRRDREPGEPLDTSDVVFDDLGRPKLRLKKADAQPSDLFLDVIARHGDNAVEFESLSDCWRIAEQAKSGELSQRETA